MNTNFDILKEKFKNVYFITGTAYAGKSTLVKNLAARYNGIACEENWHDNWDGQLTVEEFPGLCYTRDLVDWHDFVRRSPQEYFDWTETVAKECEKIELLMLPDIASQGKPVFVDTNISIETLWQISDENHVLIMLADPDISVNLFFNRPDREKQFLYRLMLEEPDPQAALDNFRKGLELINSKEKYDYYLNSGFKVLLRDENRTRKQTLQLAAECFGLDAVTMYKVDKGTLLADRLLDFVNNWSWEEVKQHTAANIKNWEYTEWETPFVAMSGGEIVGMATLMKSDYYPLPEIYPWVSTVFVSEESRGQKISGKLIDFANEYAKSLGFDKTYIPSEHIGLYEKYGYSYVKEIVNYGGGTDRLYAKDLK